MSSAEHISVLAESNLSESEKKKREGLATRKPRIAEKLRNVSAMEERGEISPIIRIEKSYLCNFKCTHCSAEYYMDRHLEKVLGVKEDRKQMTLDDIRDISKQADELGLARFVITGGEPLVMRDFDAVVEAIDPDKHYIITDSNGWFLDDKKAKHIKSIGVEKVQMSLDSFIEPSLLIFASEALKLISIFLKIIIKASLIAKVAITNKTKLIPSIKLILPKANLVMSDNESWPTVAKARPKAVMIIAFKNCPLLAKAAIDNKPTHIKAK